MQAVYVFMWEKENHKGSVIIMEQVRHIISGVSDSQKTVQGSRDSAENISWSQKQTPMVHIHTMKSPSTSYTHTHTHCAKIQRGALLHSASTTVPMNNCNNDFPERPILWCLAPGGVSGMQQGTTRVWKVMRSWTEGVACDLCKPKWTGIKFSFHPSPFLQWLCWSAFVTLFCQYSFASLADDRF